MLCPDKINSDQWLEVHRAAHAVGLALEHHHHVRRRRGPDSWATHLLRTRELQRETGGFTEFVPLPFVHMATPLFLEGSLAQGADLPRGRPHARRRATALRDADRQHSGQLGEDGRRGVAPHPSARAPTTSAAR